MNERNSPWTPGLTLAALREREKPDADVVVLNSFPVALDALGRTLVNADDAVVLIRRGEMPKAKELAALMSARHTPGVADTLRRATVGIAGAGGLGANAAHALARIGVGKLVIADFDVVEPNNLNRQAFRVEQIGQHKVEALAADLSHINPLVRVETHLTRLTPANIPGIFAACPVVLECFDRPEEKRMLVETLLEKLPETKVVAASGVAGTGDGNLVRVRKMGRRLWLIGDGESAAAPGRGLMAPRVFIAAGQQANTAVRILLGEEE